MTKIKKGTLTALGLMSGTSLDGVDAALVRTDGVRIYELGPAITQGYTDSQRTILDQAIQAAADSRPDQPTLPDEIVAAGQLVTDVHVQVVESLLRSLSLDKWSVDLIGFHGQTINHRPDLGWTWQIGDGEALARRLELPVVYDFRGADVAAGGQGAPLAPAYHQALARSLTPAPEGPLVVLNLGGVANVTWVNLESNELIAFDTGPGNGLLDEWMTVQTGQKMDEDGTTAAKGAVDPGILKRLLDNEYFKRPAPKSIDRHDFGLAGLEGLSAEDGAALLAQFTAQSVALARQHFPSDPNRWLVCGGGRHNPVLMTALSLALGMAVEPVETVGWRGDSLEAEAFGFLATAAANLLPISFPRTTGAPRPLTGGRMTST